MNSITIVFMPESKEHYEYTLTCKNKKETHLKWLNLATTFKENNKEHPSYKIRTKNNIKEVYDSDNGNIIMRTIEN